MTCNFSALRELKTWNSLGLDGHEQPRKSIAVCNAVRLTLSGLAPRSTSGKLLQKAELPL